MTILNLLAVTTPTTPPTNTQHPPFYMDPTQWLFPLLIVMVVFMFMSSRRTKKAEERKRDDMLKNMKRGDRVMTIGGMLGTVVDARESEVVLKVDESANTKIKFTRDAIKRVLHDDDAAAGV